VAVAASPKKKSRIDPMFAGIVAALQDVDDLSEHCREMLVAMTTPSLSKAKSERHDLQQLGVSMIGETLQAHKSKLISAVEVARKSLSDLEGSKSTLSRHVDDAKASLEEKQAAKTAASTAHREAVASAKSAEHALAEAMELLEKAEASHAALEKEKTGIDAAYLEHFKTPMDADEGPHHNFLKPFIENLDLEESLISALPSSCVKTKVQRGGFDDLVLSEFDKALIAKIAGLGKRIVDGASGIAERKASVASAEEAVEAEKLSEKTRAEVLAAATTAESEAEVEVSKALEEWTAFEPRVQEATDNYNLHDTKRMDFEDGPLKGFETFRDKEVSTPVDPEAATAGA